MGLLEDIWDWVQANKGIAAILAIMVVLVVTQAPNLFQSQQAIFGDASRSDIRPTVISAPSTAQAGDMVTVQVIFKNFGTMRASTNAEVGIFADYLADRWGLPLALAGSVTPIESCGGESFVDATRLVLDPGQEETVTFKVQAPGPTTVTSGGDSNWDDSHTLVVGMYTQCGGYDYAETQDIKITEAGATDVCVVGSIRDCRCSSHTQKICDECQEMNGQTGWFTRTSQCAALTHCENGICVSDQATPSCPEGEHLVGDDCVPDTLECPEGQHQEGMSCVDDEGVGFLDTLKDVWEDFKAAIVIIGLLIVALIATAVILIWADKRRR